jgi:tRNA (guanine-N7-)-methyltransferase
MTSAGTEVSLSPEYAFTPSELIPDDFFQRLTVGEIFPSAPEASLEIDLGAGDGGFLMAMAEQYPQRNFIAVERLLGRVRKISRDATRQGRENVRVLRLETTYALEWLLPRAADRVHLLFPDPWPKKKHHKRRLMAQPEFLRSVHRALRDGGEFLFKTDHAEYFEHVMEVIPDIDFFEILDWSEGDFFYPQTDFEKQWLEQGRSIHCLRLRKI